LHIFYGRSPAMRRSASQVAGANRSGKRNVVLQ
jgi:hypothetical protein